MFPQVWQTVVGRAFETVEGSAAGYEIFRVRGAVFPGIADATDACVVSGIVYLEVDPDLVARLDRFEGEFYERRAIPVSCSDGRDRVAEAYVVPRTHREGLTSEPWTRESFLAVGGLERFINEYAGFARTRDGG